MAMADKREDAERLYVRQFLSCAAIASELKVDIGTVYRWKAEAAKKSSSLDWDVQRRIYNMSPRELMAMYAETVKIWLVKINDNPDMLADSKVADAISKHISVLQRIDARGQYLGVAIDLIKVINTWLAENKPELKTQMDPYWDHIYESLKEYSTSKGLF